ncbi:hypothetical protein DKX38_024075 [Salix brachista]|uniref:Pentatricopeptide repeat-containing protein n=1 Tax=Salix brachista TaxID=2182728 RepID=A0A5N5JMC2_9ROSI|nr:hypothetical protein DKX38_024075 [Salix brachista]
MLRPMEFTYNSLLDFTGDLKLGRQFHACAMKIGLDSIVFAGSAILDLYMGTSRKGARFEEALKLFKQIPERNVVSWNTMIGGFSQMGSNEEAVNLFVEMIREGLEPSQFALPCSTVIATANMVALEMAGQIKAFMLKHWVMSLVSL